MESKHTAGAWEAVFDNDERGQPQVIYRGLICFLKHAPDGRISVVTDGRSCAPEEWEANAHLISAAPDLLEALRAMLDEHGYNGAAEDQRIEREARAAILKATGGAP